MAIPYRPHFAPQFLLGFLLWWLGFGAILLVVRSLSSMSAAIGVGELAVAVALLILCARIWRASEGARWMAGVFAVFWYYRTWLPMLPARWNVSWLSLVHAYALIAISVGLWRAQRWARWAAGLASILSSIMLVLIMVGVYPAGRIRPPELSEASIVGMCFALFWATIAFYLVLPSTGALFDQMRAAREPSD